MKKENKMVPTAEQDKTAKAVEEIKLALEKLEAAIKENK